MTYSIAKIKTSIRVDREVWHEFCRETRRRGTSSCPVLETLMRAYLEGLARTKDQHATIVVNLTMQHVVQRPRRILKKDWVPYKPLWPPSCEFADDFIKSRKIVGCLERKDYVKLRECWQHYRQIHTALVG